MLVPLSNRDLAWVSVEEHAMCTTSAAMVGTGKRSRYHDIRYHENFSLKTEHITQACCRLHAPPLDSHNINTRTCMLFWLSGRTLGSADVTQVSPAAGLALAMGLTAQATLTISRTALLNGWGSVVQHHPSQQCVLSCSHHSEAGKGFLTVGRPWAVKASCNLWLRLSTRPSRGFLANPWVKLTWGQGLLDLNIMLYQNMQLQPDTLLPLRVGHVGGQVVSHLNCS